MVGQKDHDKERLELVNSIYSRCLNWFNFGKRIKLCLFSGLSYRFWITEPLTNRAAVEIKDIYGQRAQGATSFENGQGLFCQSPASFYDPVDKLLYWRISFMTIVRDWISASQVNVSVKKPQHLKIIFLLIKLKIDSAFSAPLSSFSDNLCGRTIYLVLCKNDNAKFQPLLQI